MATPNKKQHYVPAGYLAAWCDPDMPAGQEPYVWAFPAEGGSPRRKPPAKLFHERDLYTQTLIVPGGLPGRDLRIEHGLGALEDAFVRTRRDFLDGAKPMPPARAAKLLAFVAAQQWRTPQAREHIRSQWAPVLEKMDELERRMKAAPETARRYRGIGGKQGKTMTHDDVRRLVDQPLQASLLSYIALLTPELARLNLAVLCTEDTPGFITSDDPCVWHDPAAHLRSPMHRSPALMYETLEITMPLTPRRMLLLSHRPLIGYIKISGDLVDDLNRRTRAFAVREFVGRGPTAKAIWYVRGEPPGADELGPSVVGGL